MVSSPSNAERAKSPSPDEVNQQRLMQLEAMQERMEGARERFSLERVSTPMKRRSFSLTSSGTIGRSKRSKNKSKRPNAMLAEDLLAEDDMVSIASSKQMMEVSSKLDELSKKMEDNRRVEQRIDQLMRKMEKMSDVMAENAKIAMDDEEMDKGPEIDPQPVGTVLYKHDQVQWNMTGYKSLEPNPDMNYFPGLAWQAEGMECRQVISGIIPCFNEGGEELHRTVQGLSTQYVHSGWRIESVIVMDGVDHMSRSMSEYLETMFGVAVNSKDPAKDPFLLLPDADTVIIHAADKTNCQRRARVVNTCSGGYSLVLKRTNRRKANSQMWWLGAHAPAIKCLYALATDCGTVFDRTTTARLIQRLSDESDLHACTGFQRTMSARMQGDSGWEFCLRPFDFMLRMLQRFEFEVDHITFKGVDDALGTMHVIPGPCGLYRYRTMGSLTDGLMHHYFQIFRRKSSSLMVGNVELVEDRIPGALLAFPLKPSKAEPTMPSTGWSRTGYCHDALFYLEAEKPLSQLVKQRRRWLNGTYATYFWLLAEGIITRSNQASTTRTISWIMVFIHIVQGITVRCSGPALLIVWMWRFGLFLPDIFSDPANIFDPTVAVADLEAEPFRLWCSLLFGGGYAFLYVWFVLAHKPRAVPVENDARIVRYSEAQKYRSDKSSAYNPFVMWLSVVVNVAVLFLFIANAGGIIYTQGFEGTPMIVKILIGICLVPFGLGFLDGLTRLDFRSFFHLILSALPALPMMVWFTVWLPAYATTRASDLTWGNRGGSDSLDASEKALERAERGSKLASTLIASNLFISIFVIWRMQQHGLAFPLFVLTYTVILSIPFVFSFLEMFFRFFNCCAGSFWRTHPDIEDASRENMTEMLYGDMSDFVAFGADGAVKKDVSVDDDDDITVPEVLSDNGSKDGSKDESSDGSKDGSKKSENSSVSNDDQSDNSSEKSMPPVSVVDVDAKSSF